MSSNYGLGLGQGLGLSNLGANANRSLMNRASNAVKSTWGLVAVGFGIILIIFVLLVIYNETIGSKVRDGWETIKTILRNKGIIEVELSPGGKEDAGVTATLTPEPSVILPPLTAALLPEPVTVPKPADNPPTDNMHIPADDRPAGLPGAEGAGSTALGNQMDLEEGTGRVGGSGPAEVFNISRNIYTFNDAAAVCAAAGAELATYDQVKDAYEKGADWCNYGWVKGQMAVYPTQKETWKKLQKGSAEFRNACGMPGINGGYFDNPELRFGVNCYGPKPPQKESDAVLESQVALPKSAAELEFDKQVQRFRDQMDAASILPFTKGKWNE